MKRRIATGMKKAAALMMSLFIILSQFAIPAAALAADLSSLPTLYLHYASGESMQSVTVMPGLYSNQPVYWATVPGEALYNGVTLEIIAAPGVGDTYNSSNGYQLYAPDASAVEDGMRATMIEVYQGGSYVTAYPLYISTQSMPAEPPAYFDPRPVQVNYYDQDNQLIGGYEDYVGMEGKTFYAEQLNGYELSSSDSVTVTMDGSGQLSQNTVNFYYTKIVRYASITMKIVDSANWDNVFYSSTQEYSEGYYTFTPDAGYLPENYQLDSADSKGVSVYGDGTADMYEVVFTATYYAPAPKTASITMKIVDSANWDSVFYSDTQEYPEGYYTFTPDAGYLPENYQLDNASPVAVNVYSDGTADMYEVIFTATYYAPTPKTASITMKIVDSANWDSVFYSDTQEYPEGYYTFTPDAGYLPENYQLDNASPVAVNVYSDGTADMYEVIFTATYYAPAPKTASITMKIVDSANRDSVFYSDTQEYPEGYYTFTPDAGYLPENYQLDNADPVSVSVYADGTADMYEVVFTATYYAPQQPEEPVEPKYATITMKIVDSANWDSVFYSDTQDYPEGYYTFTPDAGYLPENYQLDNGNPVSVSVYADGTADMYEVVFTATYYAPQQPEQPVEPKYATITMKIVDSANWDSVFYSDTQEYPEGYYTFTPDAGYLPENYQLDNADPVSVSVYADGTADMYDVVFTATYYAPQQPEEPVEPKYATITMKIVDSANWDNVFYSNTDEYPEGYYTFTPDTGYLPENYQLDNADPVSVSVYADGTADMYDVVFTATYYAPQQPEEPVEPKYATITMKIVDSANWDNVFYSNTDEYPEGYYTFTPDAGYLPENYQLDNGNPVSVSVYADGTADMYDVVFTATYYAPQQPEEPEKPDAPALPEGVTLLETLNCQGETTKGSLRFRSEPSTSSDKNIVFKGVAKGVVVQVTKSVQNKSGELWYGIIHNGTECYVRGDCLQLIQSQPASARVTFLYQDEMGHTVLDSYEETFTEGTYHTAGFLKTAPEGYEYAGVSAESFTVDASGANPAVIVFTYKAVQPMPIEVDVTFAYVCEGQPIETVVQTFASGTYQVSDYIRHFEGYTFTGASREVFVIGEDGEQAGFTITFDYNRNPVTAFVTIHHRLEDGTEVPGLSTEEKTLEKNTYSANAFAGYAEGYSFLHATPETFTVDENNKGPFEVYLYYRRDIAHSDVTVHIQDETGAPIHGMDSYTVNLVEGQHSVDTFRPDTPEGYAFVDSSAYMVEVTAEGADPAQVTFTFRKIPVEAQVGFLFVDEEGNAVPGLDGYTLTLGKGTYTAADYAYAAPHGYLYKGVSAEQIVIDENGASPAEVWFTYTKLPESISIPVYHKDANGIQLLDTTYLTFGAADFNTTHDVNNLLSVSVPEGYVLGGVDAQTVIIDSRGGVSPAAITVTYVVRPIAEADVTFHYLCENHSIAQSQTHTLTEGEWETNEYAVKVEGYNLTGASIEKVIIGVDGVATPAEVTFTYEKLVTTAFLKVHYRNSFGEELTETPEVRELSKGIHSITPNPDYAPAGYVLSANTQVFEVTVHDDLTLSVPSVSFNYYPDTLKATVTVNYHDTTSATIFATEQVQLSPGTHELQPNLELIKSKGNYEKSDYPVNSVVVVNEKGEATPNTIVFYYKPAAYTDYQGYLLVTQPAVLRQNPSTDSLIRSELVKDTVLFTTGQHKSGAVEWYSSYTMTGEPDTGWVDSSFVSRISAEDAKIYIEEANQPEELLQDSGYYITMMDNVPLRQYKNTASQAKYLNVNTVVWVDGQEYDEAGTAVWHRVKHENVNGYVRDGQLRKLSQQEVDQYLANNPPITPDDNPNQYDPNGPSSYGYVTKDSVNFRSEPGGTRIKMINQYGMALIVGTREVNGVTWYNINYDGQLGWIHGDYFHQMTLTEFTSFVGSEAYFEGITNNAVNNGSSGSTGSNGSSGSPTQGDISSVEDWNVGIWQNPGVNTQPSYQPFNPYATPVATTNPRGEYIVDSANVKFYSMASENASSVTLPEGAEISIKGTVNANGKTWYQVTYEGRNGYVDVTAVLDKLSATPTPAPTSTFVIGTMIPIQYEDESKETQGGTVPWGLIAGGVALVGLAGGAYAFALNQNKKRKAAARAAASKRAAAANAAAAGTASPYARRAVAAAPGAQQRPQGQPGTRPIPVQQPAANPYSRPAPAQQPAANPYSRPAPAQQPAANPYAGSAPAQQNASNPYARPQQSAPIANPYAAGSTAPAQQSNNPYARPIAPAAPAQPSQADAQTTGSDAPAPRRSRMQRYHSADAGNDGASTDA